LELEITESVLIEDIRETNQILYRLRALGIKLSLDDFGTGYSSLNYLRHMPIHTLKIDKSFLTEKYKDNKDSQIIRTIMMLAHVLNLEVVAEGVETKDQLNYLHDEGCDFLQGYYLSKPIDKEEIERILMQGGFFKDEVSHADQRKKS
jgi:EAL domain-containing protein (putative c-di-GMP-specific phosphodiesterase class I)